MPSTRTTITSLFLLLGILLMQSCAKEEVTDIPEVSFISPRENDRFTYGDTIEVAFSVKSISEIQGINISIVDENLTPVFENHSYSGLNGRKEGVVHYAIIHNRQFLPPGRYQVMARVENQKEQKHKYRYIQINAPQAELLGAALITKTPHYINVWHYDNNFSKSLKASMQGDYSGSAYLPFHNRMVLSAKVQGNYTMWNYLTGDTILDFAAKANPPFPYFTGVGIVDNLVTTQYYGGAFSLSDYMGHTVKMINTTSGYWADKVFDVGEDFVSIEYSKSTQDKRLVTHVGLTGMNYSYYVLQGPVVAALPFEGKDFMMFSNYNGGGQIELFVWNNNATQHPVSYQGPEFIDAVQIAPKEYYLLTAETVKWFRYSQSSITDMINFQGLTPIKLLYDVLHEQIWVVDTRGFRIYAKNGNLIRDLRSTEEVLNLHLIYNY